MKITENYEKSISHTTCHRSKIRNKNENLVLFPAHIMIKWIRQFHWFVDRAVFLSIPTQPSVVFAGYCASSDDDLVEFESDNYWLINKSIDLLVTHQMIIASLFDCVFRRKIPLSLMPSSTIPGSIPTNRLNCRLTEWRECCPAGEKTGHFVDFMQFYRILHKVQYFPILLLSFFVYAVPLNSVFVPRTLESTLSKNRFLSNTHD